MKVRGWSRGWGPRIHGRTPTAGFAGSGCSRAAASAPLFSIYFSPLVAELAGTASQTAARDSAKQPR